MEESQMKQLFAVLAVVFVWAFAPAPVYAGPQDAVQEASFTAVSINTAPAAELEELPGIGPALAARVVQYRQEHGPFKRIAEIKEVKGIGDAVFNKLKDRLTL
jgi:comEA protein